MKEFKLDLFESTGANENGLGLVCGIDGCAIDPGLLEPVDATDDSNQDKVMD